MNSTNDMKKKIIHYSLHGYPKNFTDFERTNKINK